MHDKEPSVFYPWFLQIYWFGLAAGRPRKRSNKLDNISLRCTVLSISFSLGRSYSILGLWYAELMLLLASEQ